MYFYSQLTLSLRGVDWCFVGAESVVVVITITVITVTTTAAMCLERVACASCLRLRAGIFVFSTFASGKRRVSTPFRMVLCSCSLSSSSICGARLFLCLRPPCGRLRRGVARVSLHTRMRCSCRNCAVFLRRFRCRPVRSHLCTALMVERHG